MKLNFKNYLLIYSVIKKYVGTKDIFFVVTIMSVASFFEVIGIASLGSSFGIIVQSEKIITPKFLIPILGFFKNDPYTIGSVELLTFSLIVLTITMIFNIYADFIKFKILCNNKSKLSINLFEKYINKPYSEIINLNTDDLGKNILIEAERISNGIIFATLNVASSLILFLAIILLLSTWNIRALITIIILLSSIYFLIFWSLGKYISKFGKLITKATAKRFRIATESLKNIKLIKVIGIEEEIVSSFAKFADIKAKNQIYTLIMKEAPRHIIQWFIFFASIIAYFLFLNTTELSEIVPTIAIFCLAGYKLLPALQKVYLNLNEIKINFSAFDLVKKELNESDRNIISAPKLKKFKVNGDIQLINCYLKTEKTNKTLLKKINLTIKRGSKVAIVGESGSGKSSLLNLLLGLLKPSSGEIKISNEILHQTLSNKQWRSCIGYVPQSVFLIDGTVKANVALMETIINEENIIKASNISLLDKALKDRKCDLNELVGDNGIKFSGGQVQRIGIARAIYKMPSVLILDEATGALDSLTEQRIFKNIFKYMNQITVIAVTHRKDILTLFDEVIYLEDGEIKKVNE